MMNTFLRICHRYNNTIVPRYTVALGPVLSLAVIVISNGGHWR